MLNSRLSFKLNIYYFMLKSSTIESLKFDFFLEDSKIDFVSSFYLAIDQRQPSVAVRFTKIRKSNFPIKLPFRCILNSSC